MTFIPFFSRTLADLSSTSIALIGYGKMGKAIASVLNRHWNTHPALILTSQNFPEWTPEKLRNAGIQLVFEFTHRESAPQTIARVLKAGIPLVSGTTGIPPEVFEELQKLCLDTRARWLHSPNFSYLMNLVFFLVKHMLPYLLPPDTLRLKIREHHHARKKDAPSGTAIHLAELVIREHPRQFWKGWKSFPENEYSEVDGKDVSILPILWKRTPEDVRGFHQVILTIPGYEQMILEHTAFSRDAFALGACLAGAWLLTQPPGFYTFQDAWKNLFSP